MPPRRVKRKGGRQRFYARNVLIAFSSEVDTGSREENASKQESRQRLTAVFGRLMHSFPAGSANSPYTTRIHPALACFVGEVCGTLARLCAYLMTLALMAIGGSRYGSISRKSRRWRPRRRPGARPDAGRRRSP